MSKSLRRTQPGTELEERVRQIASRRARAVLERTDERVDQLESDLAVVRVDLERISHQLRALEQRLDAAANAVPAADSGTHATDRAGEGNTPDPADVLAEIRREHERIRVRFQMMSRYEERVRRLENAVVKLYGGNLRGPGRNAT